MKKLTTELCRIRKQLALIRRLKKLEGQQLHRKQQEIMNFELKTFFK